MARVMVVDDEPNIRKVFALFLEEDGHEVTSAASADEAIRKLEPFPDVVLSDIILPGMSGIDLLEHIRDVAPEVQVVMITADPSVDTASGALRNRAFDYLSKPVPSEVLCRVVRRAAQYKEVLDRARVLEEENLRYRRELEQTVKLRTLELETTNDRLREEVGEKRKTQVKLERSLARLEAVMVETIQSMATIVEKRDPYTAGHQSRVARLAKAIASQMGLTEETVRTTYLAALIHDVGKIAVPAEILSKPTRLSAVEFGLIKMHPVEGFEIIRNVEFPWPLATIVRQHHERLDGSGYPDGAQGDDIHVEARIIAVADVVEAMSSHRPYRPKLGLDVAMNEVQSNMGTLYDERAVKACHQLIFEKGFQLEDA